VASRNNTKKHYRLLLFSQFHFKIAFTFAIRLRLNRSPPNKKEHPRNMRSVQMAATFTKSCFN